jgi:hypothetical protein
VERVRQDEVVAGTDDHRGGRVGVDAGGDPAAVLLGAQVVGHLGPTHPNTVMVRQNLAVVLRKFGARAEAAED